MLESFSLTLFPPGSLANSVTTTVWVGVCVTCFFNLRLGWVLSGLVVPGYLIPLFMIKPLSAAVIIFEAVITYFLVWFYSEYLSGLGRWSSFFGRDRFFALLLMSVIVRLIFDMIVLPLAGEYVTTRLGIVFDYRNNLHSFGLIVVALLANQLWKPGFKKGIFPAFITLAATYLIVRYVLIGFTNFNMGNIVYMYEDMAASMLSSPKAYIILLTTSVVASRMNLRYGWDYSGILIPSLLALQWYQPEKLIYTFLETFVILICASLTLKLSFFKEANMEGARKTLLFFNIGFLYKLLAGWAIIWWFPQYKVTDFYGFGYLLTTLLAVKMHDKNIALRVTRATLQTSLAAVIVASAIGFGITFVPNIFSLTTQLFTQVPQPPKSLQDKRLIDVLKTDRVKLFATLEKNAYAPPLPRDLEIFSEAIKAIEHHIRTKDDKSLQGAKKLLSAINYTMTTVENNYIYLYEHTPQKGWGSYVFNMTPGNAMLIEVPAPLDEWGTLEAGTWLFTSFNARALALGGSGLKTNDDGSSDILKTHSSLFSMFQRLVSNTNILQIRGHTAKTIRVFTGKRSAPIFTDQPLIDSMLWVKSSLPSGLNLVALEKIIGEFRINWGRSPFKNILADTAHSGFAELILNRTQARDLMFKPPFASKDLPFEIREQSIVGYLQDWLLRGKENIAKKGTDLYIPPKFEELLFFDHEILTPLVNISREMYTQNSWSPEALSELNALNTSCAVMGYEIIQYHHKTSGQDYLILSEKEGMGTKRFRGSYIFRLGPSNPYIIQVPRPLSEINVFEYSVALFERIKAKCLMISTAHPLTNRDGSSDIIRMKNKESIYTLVNQVIIRENGDAPLMVVQCRAMGTALPDTDVLLALKSGVKLFSTLNDLTRDLITSLEKNGLRVKLLDGSPGTAGYEVGKSPQAMYLDHSQNKEFGTIWLSPELRAHFRQQTDNTIHANQFLALGIDTREADLFTVVHGMKKMSLPLPRGYKSLMSAYIKTHDIIVLDNIMHQWPHLTYERVIDLNSKQSFLLIFQNTDRLTAVVNLFPRDENTQLVINPENVDLNTISHYVDGRIPWLEWKKQ
ncbi:Capsule biosynthesis CapC [Desulfocicer vacuolatum DSM 3385]|uniref:Capsule biosynthesis CapC n=2 Tax=Desulfocicer vacuolatum TaxID=2298 RepID=A0A1W2A2F2_9BACT|nr:Capsule biosynthesis CapC [Desulfocicer vacuolatum DSM 3385]